MEEEFGNQYQLELQKLMSSEVSLTKWAPTMDILAIATFDNFIEGYRISFKAQRFFHIEQSQSVATMCFSPDSLILAYGLLDGSIKLIKTENGQKLISVEHLGCLDLQNLNFLNFSTLEPRDFMPITKDSIENKLILNISPHKNCNKNAIIKINYFNQLKPNFQCLLLSYSDKTYLLLNGFMEILELNYQSALQIPQNQPYRVLFSHLDDHQLYSVVAYEIQSTYKMHLVTFDLAPNISSQNERGDLISWTCLLSNVNQIFNFIDSTYVALETQVRDIIRQYNSKINLIDDGSSGDVIPCKQLLSYLTLGLTSSTLINFFSKEVYDSKILHKLDETLTTLFAGLHDIILQSVQNSLERSTLLIKKLLCWVGQGSKNSKQSKMIEKFGVVEEQLLRAEEMIRRLYTMGEMLLVESTQAKFNIRNLLVWLNKTTIKTSQENETEIENAKSYLNKYTVDYNRLHKFLENEDVFKLQNLLHFFRKTDNASKMVIPPADFSLLPNKAEESLLAKQKKEESFKKLEKLLDLQDIEIHNPESNAKTIEFYSFKIEMKALQNLWKQLCSKPKTNLSKGISSRKKIQLIGDVQISEQFDFKLQTVVKEGTLYLYYIDYPEDSMGHYMIVRYNCHTNRKTYIYTNKYKIHSISICPDELIAVLENKENGVKSLGQIINEQFNGEQMEIGRMMSNCDQGTLDVDCSFRGLNCLMVDKTKMVIFD